MKKIQTIVSDYITLISGSDERLIIEVEAMILAWDSEEARDEAIDRHGHKAKQYEDRPIRRSYWERKRDHPIHGLAHYEVPEEG